MKPVKIIAAAVLASAAQAQYFSLIAVRSASPIHFLPVNAAGERLFLGGTSSHYCPESLQQAHGCPNTVRTNFAGGEGSLSMGAIVPGGQLAFIDPKCGAVGYTQAHSAMIPTGAILDAFNYTQGPGFGTLTGGGGFVACNNTGDGTWSVYATLPNVTLADDGSCLGFDAIATNETSAAAWQYT